MNSITKLMLAAAAMTFVASGAHAQDRGPQLAIKDAHPVIKNAAERMGLVRNRALVIGQVNLFEMVGDGTVADIEAATPGAPVAVKGWRYAVQVNVNVPGCGAGCARLDYTPTGAAQTIRVVKSDKAWNEAWSADKKKLTATAVSADLAAFRNQLMWAEPHAFLMAAAYASAKQTPNGKPGTPKFEVGKDGALDTVTVEIGGTTYKGTMEPAPGGRPAKIEADFKIGGATKKFVATFTDWRAGEKPDLGFSNAFGNSLDKFHNGTYWPSKMTWELGGAKVLDVTLTEGWGNPYMIFPDPELLAKAQ